MTARALAPDDPRHGRYHTYTVLRCRCDACRKANADAARKRRAAPSRSRDSMRARSFAKSEAEKWVRANHPDEWNRMLDEGYVRAGIERLPIGRPKKAGPT